MNKIFITNFILIAAIIALTGSVAFAQVELPVRCTGDSVTYNKEENIIYGKGNVEIVYKDNYLRADNVKVNLTTKEIEAEGRVVLSDGENIFTGDKIYYNVETGKAEVDDIGSRLDPWFALGQHGERVSEEMYYIKDGYVTTCDYEKPHYRIKSRDIYIYPEDKVVAKHIIFYWGDVPLFYWPYFSKSLKDDRSPWTIIPGQNNKLGAFILIGYSMWWENFLGGRFEPTLRLDWYQKRGIGAGVYAKYSYTDRIRSLIRSYFIDDKAYEKTVGVTEHKKRGRFGMDWVQRITDTTRGIMKLNYLSDPDIVYDFFRYEFQDEVQTQNFINISNTSSWHSLNLIFRKRLNDFYTVLERLPELNFTFIEHAIGETRLFYQGYVTAGYLKQSFAKPVIAETTTIPPIIDTDYSAYRFDTRHQLRYPRKYFGWLNIVPRIGTRQTYYSKRARWETTETNTTEQEPTPPGTPVGTTTTTVTTPTPTTETTTTTTTIVDPDITTINKKIVTDWKKEYDKWTLRSVYFTGVEFTTKISRVFFVENDFWQLNQLRHVIEPRVNYTYQQEPNFLEDDLLNFGDIEKEQNNFGLSLRNKLQTRRKSELQEEYAAWDLVDLLIGTRYYPERYEEKEGEERSFSHITARLELDPFNWLSMEMDANYDQYDGQWDNFNTQMALYRGDKLSFALGYRYLIGASKLWTTELNYTVNSDWAFRMMHRFEFETGHMQRQEYILFRDLHCWDLAFIYRESAQIDEWEFYVALYPKAYPDIPVTFGTTFFGQTDTAEVNFGGYDYDIDYSTWGQEE